MRFKSILMGLAITLASLGVAQANPCPSTTEAKMKALPSIQEVYTAEVGVRELTGHNDGKEVTMYLNSVGLGKGYAWCAAFVHYCLIKAGIPNPVTAWSPTAENKSNMVYSNGRFYKEPRAGDVGTLYYSKLKRIGHTFFYDHKQSDKIYASVEGNTNGAGSREGDGVYRKYRSFNATHSISRWE